MPSIITEYPQFFTATNLEWKKLLRCVVGDCPALGYRHEHQQRQKKFKSWGVSVAEIKNLRTKIEEVIFVDPPGVHGGPGSTKAHNEILRLIDNAKSFKSFKEDLIKWADKRLSGGSNSLPEGFFEN